jgi:hypothetical protein
VQGDWYRRDEHYIRRPLHPRRCPWEEHHSSDEHYDWLGWVKSLRSCLVNRKNCQVHFYYIFKLDRIAFLYLWIKAAREWYLRLPEQIHRDGLLDEVFILVPMAFYLY